MENKKAPTLREGQYGSYTLDDETFVYIMKNEENQYKIGISKDPYKRQGTLSPKEKNLELLFHYAFPSRKIARGLESHIHADLIDFSIIGEWFKLESNRLEEIKTYLIKN